MKTCCASSSKEDLRVKDIEHAATTNIKPPKVELSIVDKREAALSDAPRHVLENTTQDPREAKRNNGPLDKITPNTCETESLWRVS